MPKDQRNNPYQEVAIPHGDVRVTLIHDSWAGMPSMRIQIRNENGHLLQGPEIPIQAIGSVFGAMVALLAGDNEATP